MGKTIWKFPLVLSDRIIVSMPKGAEILHVGLQGGTPCLWALVDPDAPKIAREFRAFGTGHSIPDHPGGHVGTLLVMGDSLVIHIFASP